MKLLMGFLVLLVALVAVMGCAQTAAPPAPTPTATTVPPTTVVTTATTAVPTTIPTPVPVNTTVIATPTPASMVTIIHMNSSGFTPSADIVLPGTGVFFVNYDSVPLTVIGIGNSTGAFNSGPIIPGSEFSYTLGDQKGILYYGLSDNPAVNGTIIVQPPSGVSTYIPA